MPVDHEAAQRAVHDALACFLDDGEIAINWTLTIDVAGPHETRYLAHRSGGGHDGTEHPTAWVAFGMLSASAQRAEAYMAEYTFSPDDDEGDD